MTGALESVAMEVQPPTEKRTVAATKLLQSSVDAERQRRRLEYSKEHQSPRADYIKHADLLSKMLARCWKKFALSKKTTLELVQAFASSGINSKSVKNMSFEDLAMSMESPPVLQATRALLDRLETRLLISTPAPVENVDHLLKHLAAPPRRTKKPAAAPRRARSISSSSSSMGSAMAPAAVPKRPAVTVTQQSCQNRLPPRYSLRVVLCAYMIVAHPSAVLSGGQRHEGETQLMESAARFVEEFDLLTRTVLDGPSGRSSSQRKLRDQLAAFDRAWCTYLYRFVAWKVKDAMVLEGDLVRAACKLKLSMMQTCKLTADGRSSPGELTHDMKAIQRQVADDQKLLRDKVQLLSGDAGVARMDCALSDTRSKFFDEAKKNAGPVSKPVADASSGTSSPPPSSPSPPVKQPTENEIMVNEMLHHQDDGSAFPGNSDRAGRTGTDAEKDFQEKLRETMEKAFWDLVTDSMTGDKPDYSQLVSLVKEVRDSLHELSPKGWKEEILEKIDVEILSQVLGSGSQDTQYLGQILQYSLGMVRRLSAAAKEDQMKKSHDKLLTELATSSEADDTNGGTSSFVVSAVKGLRFAMEEIKQLQAEVSKVRIQLAMQRIIQGSTGVEYLQNAFADRHGPPAASAPASLPLTAQWISTSKNVAKQEWREHLGSLSVVPSAAAAALVPVLRAGHGAAMVRQPPPSSSSPAAAAGGGVSGQPECKGDELDKLIRIGLLQLVSSVEGLQMQSTPESFQLNLLRLRAVQSQFQHVIVIATSMLILRQVLKGESSKPTALELERANAELFEALVKMLDGGSPDAGVEEIVEAVMSASASVGSPSSEEKMQGRRQAIARVLVKSLQPGDVVLKMVSRAVFCAFRGVVLGGSGHKGQKLADAALRGIGAARLVDRVVKASEVLIKVATVSGKVHGPWYKAFL